MTCTAEHLTRILPDIGDGLAGAFATLHRAPEPSSCEELAIRLQGAARHVMRLREALMGIDQAGKKPQFRDDLTTFTDPARNAAGAAALEEVGDGR